MIKKIISLIFTILIVGWIAIIMYDAMNSTKGEPKFCISKETKNYEDGTVEVCNGLGYKVYIYAREKYHGIEFGPFWIQEKDENYIKSLQ